MSIQYVWGHNTKHFWEVSVQVLVVAFRPFAFCSYQDWPSLSFCCGNNNNIIPLSFVRFIVDIISTILMLKTRNNVLFFSCIHLPQQCARLFDNVNPAVLPQSASNHCFFR
jgi:hypothetical protein